MRAQVRLAVTSLLYVSHDATVSEFVPGSSKPVKTLSGLKAPQIMTVDRHGNLWVADMGNAQLGGVDRFSNFSPERLRLPAKSRVCG